MRLVVAGALAVLAACRPHEGGQPRHPGHTAGQRRGGARDGVAQLVTGDAHTCARLQPGRVRCWGANGMGQLGDGTTATRYRPRDVLDLDAVDIAAAGDTTCAVDRRGRVLCWGRAVGTFFGGEPHLRPVALPHIADAVDVELGHGHACVIRKGGRVACWGSGTRGQLGNGGLDDADAPVDVEIDGVIGLALGQQFSCAMKKDRSIWCWGDNTFDQLGPASPRRGKCKDGKCSSVPQLAEHLPPLRAMRAGRSHTCGLTDEREVACWGSGYLCELGESDARADTEVHYVPDLEQVRGLASPQCAHGKGRLTCWHEDRTHQGLQTQCVHEHRDVPDVAVIEVGDAHGCAITGPREVHCWGRGDRGALGHGDPFDSAAPVAVVDLFGDDPPESDPLADTVAAIGGPLSGYALVWRDAALYAGPKGDSVGRFATALPGDRLAGRAGRVVVAVVGEQGYRVEVRTVTSDEAGRHCAGHSGPLSRYDAHYWVQRRDLVPVLPAEYADSNDEGSVVFFAAGTPVAAESFGLGVWVGRAFVPIYLDASALGLAYVPARLEPAGGELRYRELPADWEGRLLGRALRIGELPDDLVQRWSSEPWEGQVRLRVEDACRRLELIVDDRPFPERSRGGAGSIGLGGRAGEPVPASWTVRAGAPATFRGGAELGTLREAWTTTAEPESVGGRSCWRLAGPNEDLLVCHAKADVTFVPAHVPEPPPASP